MVRKNNSTRIESNSRRTFLKTVGIAAGAVGLENTIAIAQEASGQEEQPSGWTTRRGTPTRAGATDEDGPSPYVTTDWTMDPNGSAYGLEPIVADGTAFLPVTTDNTPSGNDGYIGAYDVETGEERWVQTELLAPRTPTVGVDNVYVATKVFADATDPSEPDDAGLYAFDRASGETVWSRTRTSEWVPPALANGSLYTATPTGAVALDAATGATEWQTEDVGGMAKGFDGQVSVSDSTVFLADGTALDATDGSIRWQKTDDRPLLGASAVGKERVIYRRSEYVQGDDDRVILEARSKETGDVRWSYASENNAWDGRIAVADGHVVIVEFDDGTSTVKALDERTGATEWTSELPGDFVSSPAVAKGTVYVGGRCPPSDTERGRAFVSALDLATGNHRWDYLLDDGDLETAPNTSPAVGTPVVADGKAYAVSYPAGSTLDYEYVYYSNVFVLGSCGERPDGSCVPNCDGRPDGQDCSRPSACIDVTSNLELDDFDAGESVWLNGFCSSGRELTYEWDTDGDGRYDVSGTSVAVRVPECGETTVGLKVTDSNDDSDTASVAISAS